MITGSIVCGNEQDVRRSKFRNLIEQETGWVTDGYRGDDPRVIEV